VDTEEHVQQPSTKQKCFKAKWLQEKGFQEKVQQTWEAVTNEYLTNNVLAKLNKLHGVLHEWDANVLQNPRKRLKKAQQKLEKAMNRPMNNDNEAVAKEMVELIDLLLEQEETHWMQRSRANWLKHGDRNMSFFHH
jgi:aminoglycoside phosphotransferase